MHYDEERENDITNVNNDSATKINLTLPYPPSVNHYYGNRTNGGKYIKPKGQQFRRAVNNIVLLNVSNKKLDQLLKLTLSVYPPDKRKRDIDNILKALLDSLTNARVYLDDSLIKQLNITWHMGGIVKEGRVDLIIEPKGSI